MLAQSQVIFATNLRRAARRKQKAKMVTFADPSTQRPGPRWPPAAAAAAAAAVTAAILVMILKDLLMICTRKYITFLVFQVRIILMP